MKFKREHYIEKLISSKHNHLIKIVTGLRRVGKSYLLFNLYKQHLLNNGVEANHIIEVQLDSFAHRKYRNADTLYEYVENLTKQDSQMYYVIIDEVQMLAKAAQGKRALGQDSLRFLRGVGHHHLSRYRPGSSLEQEDQGAPGRHSRQEDFGRGPRRPGKGQGSHSRISRRQAVAPRIEKSGVVSGRRSRCRQDKRIFQIGLRLLI